MSETEPDFTSPREDILRQLEDYASPLNLNHRRADLWRRAAFAFAERGDPESARRLWAEYLVISLHAREPHSQDEGDRYLHPMMQCGSLKCPDPDSIPDVMVDHLEKRLYEIANPYLKARYADFLWQRRRQHQHARAATEAHLAIVQAEGERGNHGEAAESARRALSLAFALRDRALVEVVVQTVTSISEGWVEVDSEAYSVVRIVEKILDNPRFREAPVLQRWANLLKEGLQRENDHYVRRDFLAQLARVLQRMSRPGDAQRCRVQIAEDRESEAREREPESLLVAASFYQDALKAYAELGLSDKVEEMKLKARASYKRAEETEFKALSVEFPVDLTAWDSDIAGWLTLEPADALTHLAASPDLIPSWLAAEKQTAELEQKGSLSQLIPWVTVDDGRPVSAALTEAERQLQNVRRTYGWYLGFTGALLTRALASFRDRGAVSTESLLHAIDQSPVFPADKTDIIRRGFERYVEGDHVSAIHVLVPHLEDCLRRLLGGLGVSATSFREGKMREKPLDQVLEAEEIKGVLGNRLWHYFEHVLVAETGLNLRNSVAHGLLRSDELNEHNANIIVHLYLLLGLLRATASEEA